MGIRARVCDLKVPATWNIPQVNITILSDILWLAGTFILKAIPASENVEKHMLNQLKSEHIYKLLACDLEMTIPTDPVLPLPADVHQLQICKTGNTTSELQNRKQGGKITLHKTWISSVSATLKRPYSCIRWPCLLIQSRLNRRSKLI